MRPADLSTPGFMLIVKGIGVTTPISICVCVCQCMYISVFVYVYKCILHLLCVFCVYVVVDRGRCDQL